MRGDRELGKIALQIGIALTAGVFSFIPSAAAAPVLNTSEGNLTSSGVNVAVDAGDSRVTNVAGEQRNNVVDWQDFSVAKDETVRFAGSDKNYLNVVTGENTSRIDGRLEGGKDVYIVNPNGVIFGNSSSVDVGSLYVSSRPISEVDLNNIAANNAANVDMSPLANTSVLSSEAGAVVNMGTVQADSVFVEGGNIILADVDRIQNADGNAVNNNVTIKNIGTNPSISLGRSVTTVIEAAETERDSLIAATGTGYAYTGTANKIVSIKNESELENVNSAGLNRSYLLVDDIALTGVHTPIGGDTPFTGQFDGQFHKISNINVALPSSGGLFGHTAGNASIKNVGVQGGSITAVFAGGIAGWAENTTFENVFNNGTAVNIANSYSYAGGLVGYAVDSSISSAYNTGTVSPDEFMSGGIAGYAERTIISDVYNKGYTTNGFVGHGNGGSLNNAYSMNHFLTSSIMYNATKNNVLEYVPTSKNMADYPGFDISANGNEDTVWRIYEGQSLPLLRAFLKGNGTVRVNYNYTHGGEEIRSNAGADLTTDDLTYNGNYVAVSGTPAYTGIGNIDAGKIYYANTAPNGVRNAKLKALFWTDQQGYDLVGNNVAMDRRPISLSGDSLGLTKVYDKSADARSVVQEAFSNTNRIDGIVANDDVGISYANLTATFVDANNNADASAGTHRVALGGTIDLIGSDAANYRLATNNLSNLPNVTGRITQRPIYLETNLTNVSLSKTYDGNTSVCATNIQTGETLGADELFSLENIINGVGTQNPNHGKISGDEVTLSYGNENTPAPSYVDVAEDGTVSADYAANAKKHSVRFSGIQLAGEDASNYVLCYNGTTNPVVNSQVLLTDGVDVNAGTGTPAAVIRPRLLATDGFQVRTPTGATDSTGNPIYTTAAANKPYDGTSAYTVPDGAILVANTAANGSSTGLLAADSQNLWFTLNGTASNFVDSSGAATKMAAGANAAVGVAYSVSADTNVNYEYLKDNYTFDSATAASDNVNSWQTLNDYIPTVSGDGSISRRALNIDTTSLTDINKVYDGNSNVIETEDNRYTTIGGGYLGYTTDSPSRLLSDDTTTTVSDDAAWNVTAVYDNKNVARAADGTVPDNAKTVNFTVSITGDDRINYVLNGTNAEASTVLLTGTGKITPLPLNTTFADISKTYNGTSAINDGDSTASSGIISGQLTGDDVQLAGYNADDAYYYDAINGTSTSNAGTWQVRYPNLTLTGADRNNYDLASTTGTGAGTINRRLILSSGFQVMDGGTAAEGTKPYDGTSVYNLPSGATLVADTTASGNTGVIANDRNNLWFTLSDSATSNFVDSGSNPTAKVADAVGIAYQAQAETSPGYEYLLNNYKIGTTTAATNLAANTTYPVTGAGSISRRALTIDGSGATDINKVYNASRDVQGAGDISIGGDYLDYENGSLDTSKLLADDGIAVAAGVTDNASWNVTAAYDTKDVVRDANGNVIDNGKTVNFTISLNGTDAANYTLNGVNGETAVVNLTGTGKITPLSLTPSFDPVSKIYDTTTAVYSQDSTVPGNGRVTPLSGDNVTLNYDANNAYYDSADVGTNKTVYYPGLSLDGSDAGNYELISTTGSSTGNSIIRATVSLSDFVFDFAGVSRVYNGDTAVADSSQGITAEQFITDSYIDLGAGTYDFRNYIQNLNASYASPNVSDNGGAGSVTYTFNLGTMSIPNITINGDYQNYFASNPVTRQVGTITPKTVYATINNPTVTKTYNGDYDVQNYTGPLVNFAGLVGNSTDASTAVYLDKNRGTDKEVRYNVAISDGSNYKIYYNNADTNAANYNIAYDTAGADTNVITTVTTPNNVINAKDLPITFVDITKQYDGTTSVQPVANQVALGAATLSGIESGDSISLSGWDAAYNSPNVADADTVTYRNIVLSGNDAGNYNFVDAEGNSLTAATTVDGGGTITPLALSGSYTFALGDVTKEYDRGNAIKFTGNVGGTDYYRDGSEAAVRNYITAPTVTVNGNSQELAYELDMGNTNYNGVAVGQHSATFRVGLINSNYDFSNVTMYEAANPGVALEPNEVNGVTYYNLVKMNAEITPRKVYLALNDSPAITKVYDGTTDVVPSDIVNDKVYLPDPADFLSGDEVDIDWDNITAEYADENAADNVNVIYSVGLTGADAGNYELYRYADTAAGRTAITDADPLTGTGQITSRTLTIDFVRDEHPYDTLATVTDAGGKLRLGNLANSDSGFALDDAAKALISGTYTDADVNRAADGTVLDKGLTYEGLQAALADYAQRNPLAANYSIAADSITYAVADAKGIIMPREITSPLKAIWQTGVDKVYDKTPNLPTDVNADSILTLQVDTAYDGALALQVGEDGYQYDSDSVGYVSKNQGDRALTYTITGVNPNQGNYQLADSVVTNALGEWQSTDTARNVDGVSVTGNISARPISIVTETDRKIYDGTTNVANASEKIHIAADDQAFIADDSDGVGYTVTANYRNKHAESGKIIDYTLNLTGNDNGNYTLQGDAAVINGNTATGTIIGDIDTRKVYVEPLNVNGINKVYDGTTDMSAGYSNNGRFQLAAADADTGIVAGEEDIGLDMEAIQAVYGDKHVGNKRIDFSNFSLRDSNTANDNIVGDYELVQPDITGSGTISAKALTVGINSAPIKDYDTYRALSADYATTANLTLNGLETGDDVNLSLISANYADANAGPGKEYAYGITIDNQDYTLAQGENLPNIRVGNNGQSGVLTAYDGVINRRKVYVSLADTPAIIKTYDGNTSVSAEQDVTGMILVRDGDLLNDGTQLNRNTAVINARYDNKDAGNRTVTYDVKLQGGAAGNYEIHRLANLGTSADGEYSTLEGKGVINKAKLTLDPASMTKTYNGTAAIGDGTNAGDDAWTKDKLVFKGVNNESFTLTDEAFGKVIGQYGFGSGDANVSWNGDEVAYKDVQYTGLSDALAVMNADDSSKSISKNYTIDDTAYFNAAEAKGKIEPVVITKAAMENWKPVIREYNADTDLQVVYDYSGGVAGKELGINDILTLAVTDIDGNELAIDYDAVGNYDDKHVGSSHVLNYHINSVNKKVSDGKGEGNYVLDTSVLEALKEQNLDSAAEQVYSVITPRELDASVVNAAGNRKIYDGTANADTGNYVLDEADQAVLRKDNLLNDVVITAYYDDKNASAAPAEVTNNKTITYTLGLDDNSGNYVIATPTATAKGDIEQRRVYVEAADIAGIDKIYDGTAELGRDYSNAKRFKLADAGADTGIIAGDADIQLDTDAIQGKYANAHVQRNGDGTLAAQDILFTNFTLYDTFAGNDNSVNNYYVVSKTLTGSGTISPASLTVDIANAPNKVYDGSNALSDTYTANDNFIIKGLVANDSANLMIESAAYADANAGKNKDYTYVITIDNPDYELTQGANAPDITVTAAGKAGTITAHDGTITPRVLSIESIAAMNKVYDGTTDGVENAAANITLGNYIAKDKGNLGLTAVAVYDNANAGISENSDELEKHTVTYTLSLNNGNYQLAEDVVTGEGTISRKGLNIVATPAAVNMGEAMPEFTGTVEGLVLADSSLADAFNFAPDGNATTNIPGSYAVYGWYNNRFSGNLGRNYTFAQDTGNDTVFTVNYINTANNNPDTKIAPNNDVYKQMSKDMNSGFGDNGTAAIEYRDKSGNVLAKETIDSGEIHGIGTPGEAKDDGLNPNTKLAKIGIVGGDIVNIEGADAAGRAAIEVSEDGTVINLEVLPLQEDDAAQKSGIAEITGTDNITNTNEAAAQIEIVDGSRKLEENEDKAEEEEKEGEIAIENSDKNEIELKVENEGVNVA